MEKAHRRLPLHDDSPPRRRPLLYSSGRL